MNASPTTPPGSAPAAQVGWAPGPPRASQVRVHAVFALAVGVELLIGVAGVVFSLADAGDDDQTQWALVAGSVLMPIAVACFVWLDRHAANPRRLFEIALVVLCVIGATWVVLVAAGAGDTGGAVLAVLFGLIPAPVVVASFLWIDRYEPEPLRYLIAAIAWGAVVAPALVQPGYELLARNGASFNQLLTLWAPVCEETAKGLLIALVVWRRRERITGVVDGLVYGGLVGLGFSFTEDVLYIARGYAGELSSELDGADAATGVFMMRGLISPFSHSLFACAFGIGVGVAVTTRRRWLRVVAPIAGLGVGIGLHALWNGSVAHWGGQGFLLVYGLGFFPIFLGGIALAAWVRAHQGRVAMRGLDDAVAHGWIHPDEIPWLSRFALRRRARGFALRYGGPTAESALKHYQKAALRMAFIHDRVQQGSGPADGPERVRELLAEMARSRPYILLPPPLQLAPRAGWTPPPPNWSVHTPPAGWPPTAPMRQTGPPQGGYAASPQHEQPGPPPGAYQPRRVTPPADSDER